MTIEITQPITVRDLRKLIDYQLRKPAKGEKRAITGYFEQSGSGWVVKSLKMYQGHSQEVVLTLDKGGALMTKRGDPKHYKSMEAMFNDLRVIAGDDAVVAMAEGGWE